jgi:SAM-dependent methyltransferase
MTPLRDDALADPSVLEAAELMTRTGQFVVPLAAEDGSVAGIVSPTEIVVSLARRQDPAVTKARDIASPAVTIAADTVLEEGQRFLRDHGGIAAVVDEGRLAGLINLWDLQGYIEALEDLGPCAAGLIPDISPNDKPGRANPGMHLRAGVSALECIREGLVAAGKDNVRSLLDFPCGYGRILRVLKAGFPDAKLSAGDIDRDAVAYCAATFGASPIHSGERPEDIGIADSFDVVWVGSLLTHVGADRWPGFLMLFRSCLEPEGVLVFTCVGRRDPATLRSFGLDDARSATLLADFDRSGFAYVDYGWDVPGVGDRYGIALASQEWVRKEAEEAGLRVLSYSEWRWNAPAPHQDVVVCVAAD